MAKATVAIYVRKSSESEDRQILSIDSQVRELKQYAQNENIKISEVFTESKSAKAPGRDVFNKLISLIQKGDIDGIVCWKLDRLARNPIDGGAVIWAFEENKLNHIFTPQRTFFNNGNDKFWMQLEFGMAKKYVDDLSDNVKRGIRAKLKTGWFPGLPPLGYLNDKLAKTIVIDPERFSLVRQMWDLMITGNYSPRAVLEIASDKLGLRTRKMNKIGGGLVAYSTIYAIFTNPFYYGEIFYNGEYYSGAHEPMITKSEFDRVQYLLGRSVRPRPQKHRFAFTGLIKCGECGASITAEHKKNRYGYKYIYYHCTKRKRTIRCNQKVIESKKLETQIISFLESITISKEIKDWTITLLHELHEEELAKNGVSCKSLQKRHDACKKELSELLNMKIRGLLNDSEYLKKKKELEEKRHKLKELLEDTDGCFNKILTYSEKAFDFAYTAKKRFENGTLEDKRNILSYTGSNLILKNKILHINPQKPLFLIQKTLRSQPAHKTKFEPLNISLDKTKNRIKDPEFSMWLPLVKEVRTFYKIFCYDRDLVEYFLGD